jgi:hypothetical protein
MILTLFIAFKILLIQTIFTLKKIIVVYLSAYSNLETRRNQCCFSKGVVKINSHNLIYCLQNGPSVQKINCWFQNF